MIAYFVFLIWAFLPEEWLWYVGISYYPAKNYALSLPCFAIVTYVLFSIGYISTNMINTFEPSDMRTVSDKYTRPAQLELHSNTLIRSGNSQTSISIPDIGDLNPVDVSYLYLQASNSKQGH